MKRQIRTNVFETNSSSTHSIAVPKSCDAPNYVCFHTDEFGWEFGIANAADYFYTAIYEVSETEDELNENINKLKNILNEHGVDYDLNEPEIHIWHSDYSNKDCLSLYDGYIDHGNELKEFVCELLNNGDKLVRFLNGGLVFTGNDNDDNEGFIDRFNEFIEYYDWRTKATIKYKNPYYMSNHEYYDWYYKGN